jgi:Putative metallopeptidase
MAAFGRVSWTPEMNRSLSALSAAVLLSFMLAGGSPAAAQAWLSIPANPKVDIAYVPPASQRLESVYQALKGRQVLEELQHFLAPLRLPHRLLLQTRECSQVNAFYSPFDRSLTICYELVGELIRDAPPTISEDGFITHEAAIVGTLVGVVLHEGGHMMFDMLDVPVFGREEDAADETASFLALQFNKDVQRTIIKGFVYFWAKSQDPSASSPMRVWSDEHGTPSQRMYNTLCLAYGGDPQGFQEFVDHGWLPAKRAEHCRAEFAQLRLAFVKTILPFIDRDMMVQVQKMQWLTAEELK